jgi:hypothetical protein
VIINISDARTIALLRERLRKVGVIAEFFVMFEVYLRRQGPQMSDVQIIDAIHAPIP